MSKPILPLPGHPYAPPQPQAPQGPSGAPPPQPPNQPVKPTYSKRGKITIVACVPCRKRKTKCDGKRPECTQCQSRDGQCLYDMSEDQRRLTFLRENVEHLAEEKTSLEALLWNLSKSPEQESYEILRRLRSGTDPHTLAQHIQAGRSLAQVRRDSAPSGSDSAYPPLASHSKHGSQSDHLEGLVESIARSDPGEVDEIIRRLRSQEDVNSILSAARAGTLRQPMIGQDKSRPGLESDFSSQDQTFGLTRTGSSSGGQGDFDRHRVPNAHTPLNQNNRWTTVTNDVDFIEHLVTVYFTWQHSFFQSFPEHLFRQDMASGATKYCSRFLVNAICAAGCLLSTHPKAVLDSKVSGTGYMAFFEEAMRLVSTTRESQSSIPTVAGLFLLCHVEGYRGRLDFTWDFCGRSGRLALDLNLHLRSEHAALENAPSDIRVEDRAKLHTFWGCYISDQVTSFTLGRLPQIPTNAITIDLPPVVEEEDQQPWIPYGLHRNEVDLTPVPGYSSTTFFEVASLSKIVNSTLLMFFAPSETISGNLLLTEYEKYQAWYRKLPRALQELQNAPPHILCLHMYYHAAVLLLFRPFLRAKFTESNIVPRDVCRASAKEISDIYALHCSLYSTVGIYTFQIHCLLTACTIHLINLPSVRSEKYLTAACNHFHDLLPRHEWAGGSLSIIKGLVRKWNIALPQEVDKALFKNDSEVAMQSFFDDNTDPALTSLTSGSVAYADIFRPQKRVALVNPSPEGVGKRPKLASASGPAPTANMGQSQRSGLFGPRDTSNDSSSAAPSNIGGPTAAAPPTAPPPTTTYFLFAPFPNQPAPLLGPIHTSTSAETTWNDEMSKMAQGFDGLTFDTSEGSLWFSDPYMGFGWVGDAE